MPNIKGEIGADGGTNAGFAGYSLSYQNGALSFSLSNTGIDLSVGSYKSAKRIKLDASQSSSIYGNADTVQPPAISLIPQIKF